MTCSTHHNRFHRPLLEPLEDRTLLSVYMVERLTDTGEGSGLAGDLRYCITQAMDGDTIQFGVQGVINLNSALPDLAHSISIEGPGSDVLTVQVANNGRYRILAVDAGITVTISGLTLAKGNSYYPPGNGGGILNSGTLTITKVTFANNAAFDGGAIYNAGALAVNDVTFSGNHSNLYGAGIYNDRLLTLNSAHFPVGPRREGAAASTTALPPY
jgi:hypothetical protein